jgi:hypothetical protein
VARTRLVAVVALFAAAAAVVPAGPAATGDDRVLAVLATYGPTPYSDADFRRVASAADSFFRASSFGRVHLRFDVTPWLEAFGTVPSCGGLTNRSLDGVVAPARDAARTAGYDPDGYDQVMYALAEVRCGFHGVTWGQQVMLVRPPSVDLLFHGLGHTLGLGHAQAAACALRCGVIDPGDPYSPMGTGLLDFSAYEKSVLGWIGRQPHAIASGTYTIVAPTRETKLAQALVVDTAFGQFWLEYRTRPFRGLLVRFVEANQSVGAFAPSAILILRPTGTRRDWIAAGETFRAEGLFSVRLVRAGTGQASLRLRWVAPRHAAVL